MKITVVAALSVLALAAASVAAQAQEFTIDLKKNDPNTAQGKAAIEQIKTDVAVAQCGPLSMPQPIDLEDARATCQTNVKRQVQARVDAAIAREEAQMRYSVVANK